MADPFARKIYLQELPDRDLSVRFSSGARSRAAQLGGFLRSVQASVQVQLGAVDGLELVVLSRRDWTKLLSHPYGWPLTRSHPAGVSIVVAADYSPRLLHRWDHVLVRAARAGVHAPGTVRAFLDLLVGHEWGRAVSERTGLRSRVGWLDELLASYLYLTALRSAGEEACAERLTAWAHVQLAGSAPQHTDLAAFTYPRGRLPFDDLLWFQGVLTLRAASLAGARGWEIAHALRGHLGVNRDEVVRLLAEVDEGFEAWFESSAQSSALFSAQSELTSAP